MELILREIELFKQAGADGIVCAALTSDAQIDVPVVKQMVAAASPLPFTFHRAFDRCKDPFNALEDIIKTGCKRILTSGQLPNAAENLPLLKKLVEQAGDRIIIMPGSGVRSNNIKEILTQTGATEIHSSARKMLPSQMLYFKGTMHEELLSTGVDTVEIKKMLEIIKH
jgi:copper homeostasis protein